VKGLRFVEDRRPRATLWLTGKPRSLQAKRSSPGYVAAVQAEARKHFPEPLTTAAIDVELVFVTRPPLRLDVDNVAKPLLDSLKGIVYADDAQIRTIKVLGLRLDQSWHAHGSPVVWRRLLRGAEFMVNIYEGGAVDVYIIDANTGVDEKPSGVAVIVAVDDAKGGGDG
jgi:Holliday junction resolvase RusA-like endonuclease